jgi:drug/metabolite transporter (DMT)-like permease
MNLSKGLIGSLLLGLCLLGTQSVPLAPRPFLFLAVSGVIGISVGDTFFFKALMELGPRLTSLLSTLYPVSIALSAVAFLGERPSSVAWSGILLTTAGVGWVLWERAPNRDGVGNKKLGLFYALLAILSTTVAVLLAKIGVKAVPALEASLVRLLSGTVGLMLWGYATKGLTNWLTPLRMPRIAGRVVFVVMIVVFGGFWLSLVALKNIDASVAGTLNATSPLFVLLLARVMLKERISVRSVVGTALSIGGVGLILLG